MKKALFGIIFGLILFSVFVAASTVDKTSIKLQITQGYSLGGNIKVTNSMNYTQNVVFYSKTLTHKDDPTQTLDIQISDTTVNANSYTYVPFTIQTEENQLIGIYRGTMQVQIGSEPVKNISFEVEVNSPLKIKKINVNIDGKGEDITDGGTVKQDAAPGSKVKIKVTAENVYNSTGPDIEDIEVEMTVFNIDDGDDIEDDGELDDLEPGDKDSITFEFDVPMFVDNDDYTVLIKITGKDENGRRLEDKVEFKITVNKNKHDIKIYKYALDNSVLECSKNTNLQLKIVNVGSKDEDNAFVIVRNSALGIDFKKIFSLEAGSDEDDISASVTVPITVNENVKPGTYRIDILAGYDTDKTLDSEFVNLEIRKCGDITQQPTTQPPATVPQPQPPQQPTSPQNESVDVIKNPQPGIIITEPSSTEKNLSDSIGYIILLALLNVLIIIVIIVLVAKFFAKKY